MCIDNEADGSTGLILEVTEAGPTGCVRFRVIRLRTRRIELWWGDDSDFGVVLGTPTRPA